MARYLLDPLRMAFVAQQKSMQVVYNYRGDSVHCRFRLYAQQIFGIRPIPIWIHILPFVFPYDAQIAQREFGRMLGFYQGVLCRAQNQTQVRSH